MNTIRMVRQNYMFEVNDNFYLNATGIKFLGQVQPQS